MAGLAAKKGLCSFAGGVAAGSPRAASVSAISGADGAMSVRGTSENLSVRSAVAGGGAGSAGGDSGVEDVRGIDLNDGGVPVPGAPFSNMAALALTFDVAILAWGIVAKVRHPVLSFSPLLPSDATRFSPSTTTTGGHRRTFEKANFWNRFPTLPSLHPLYRSTRKWPPPQPQKALPKSQNQGPPLQSSRILHHKSTRPPLTTTLDPAAMTVRTARV